MRLILPTVPSNCKRVFCVGASHVEGEITGKENPSPALPKQGGSRILVREITLPSPSWGGLGRGSSLHLRASQLPAATARIDLAASGAAIRAGAVLGSGPSWSYVDDSPLGVLRVEPS